MASTSYSSSSEVASADDSWKSPGGSSISGTTGDEEGWPVESTSCDDGAAARNTGDEGVSDWEREAVEEVERVLEAVRLDDEVRGDRGGEGGLSEAEAGKVVDLVEVMGVLEGVERAVGFEEGVEGNW